MIDRDFLGELRNMAEVQPRKTMWILWMNFSSMMYWVWLMGGLLTWQWQFYLIFIIYAYLFGKLPAKGNFIIIFDILLSIGFILFIVLNLFMRLNIK